jgi:hypothetical protein
VKRINGRNVLTMLVLLEKAEGRSDKAEGDEFETKLREKIRVLNLAPRNISEGGAARRPDAESGARVTRPSEVLCVVDLLSMTGISAQELVSVVNARHSSVLSRDSMLDLFRRGEILSEGRTNEEGRKLVRQESVKGIRTVPASPEGGNQMQAAVAKGGG